jgi:hypothetical protein
VGKGDFSEAVRCNRKAVREQIKQAAEAEPPQQMIHGKNGETAPIYEKVDLDNLDEISKIDEESVPEFPLDTLPDTFRKPIEEVMRHYRVPAILPATCALCINSAALGRGVCTESNVGTTYANLYALIAAESGTGKSRVFNEFVRPLANLESELLERFNNETSHGTKADLKMIELEIKKLVSPKSKPKDLKEFREAEDYRRERLAELSQRQAELEDQLEFSARLRTVDCTSEALALLLSRNKEQMAVLSDEGGLVIYNIIGRYTKGDITDDILLCTTKSVMGIAVDRVGRPPIILKQPCVAMLLLVQPDILERAFSNERLLVGGLLARCLSADTKMMVHYESEENLAPPGKAIMEAWDSYIREVVEMFRFAEESYSVVAAKEVHQLSRQYYNQIVDQVRGDLADVKTFAMRWCERAWEIALNLHIATYGVDGCANQLSKETFENAIRISRFFGEQQLEVLRRPRIEAEEKRRDRLREVLEKNNQKPITLRTLAKTHGLKKEEVISCVKTQPEVFGMVKVDPPHGGSKSTLVFLKSHPPEGWVEK